MRIPIQRKVDKANDLSRRIDQADERPKDLIAQFNKLCEELQVKHRIDYTAYVKAPENW